MADVLELMGHNGVEVAAELAMRWCNRGGKALGDYLEFGTYRGQSFAAFYHAAARKNVSDIRFFGFDSFAGLPETPTCAPAPEGASKTAFLAGNYACSESEFREILAAKGVDTERVTLIPGFYNESLTDELKTKLNIGRAGIINIDCDLYESTVDVLRFVTDYVADGTLILFDDWFAYDAHPFRGERRACAEWLTANPQICLTEYFRYTRTGIAFIANILTKAEQQLIATRDFRFV